MGFLEKIKCALHLGRQTDAEQQAGSGGVTAPAPADALQRRADQTSTAPLRAARITPGHIGRNLETTAQRRYDAFQITFQNDPAGDRFTCTTDATYAEMLFCALLMLETMGREDEGSVMGICQKLTDAAAMYHSNRRSRVETDAQAIFAGSRMTGNLNADFLGAAD